MRQTMAVKSLKNKKGLAVLEVLVLTWVMFILLGATLGSWGLVHTGILNSIAARNYSFFSFNNRADLAYLRDFVIRENDYVLPFYYEPFGSRFAVIVSEKLDPTPSRQKITATLRKVDFMKGRSLTRDDDDDSGKILEASGHKQISKWARGDGNFFNGEGGKATKKAAPVAWIMVGYGICLTEKCGD